MRIYVFYHFWKIFGYCLEYFLLSHSILKEYVGICWFFSGKSPCLLTALSYFIIFIAVFWVISEDSFCRNLILSLTTFILLFNTSAAPLIPLALVFTCRSSTFSLLHLLPYLPFRKKKVQLAACINVILHKHTL